MNGCDIAVAAVVIAVVMWNTRRVFHISIAFCNTSIVILHKMKFFLKNLKLIPIQTLVSLKVKLSN